MTDILEIFCDEAGHTGPDMLHREQRFFSYASVNVSDEEAWDLIQEVKTDFRLQMPELKANKLIKTENGRRAIERIVDTVDGHFAVNVLDKLLALGGWFFEYIYEPVYKDAPWFLYEKDLHRFVASFVYLWYNDKESHEVRAAITQFQNYMRSKDPKDAPLLFNNSGLIAPLEAMAHPFHPILHFAYGYRDLIIADNQSLKTELPDGGKWTLDLSASGLWSHLNHWGRKNRPLKVKCDSSKPLVEIVKSFTGDEFDPAIRRQREKGNRDPLGWKLTEPVNFVDSRNHPAMQIADVLAGTTVGVLINRYEENFMGVVDKLHRHMLPDTMLFEIDSVNPKNRTCAVNSLILFDLAKRAECQRDPYFGLEEMYRYAEISWVKGESPFQKA